MKIFLTIVLMLEIVFLISCKNGEVDKTTGPKIQKKVVAPTTDSINTFNFVDSSISQYTDTADDDEIIAYLDSLPMVADTANESFDEMVFSIRNVKIFRPDYRAVRNATERISGFTNYYDRYFALLPLTDAEKLYADLIIGLTKEANFLASRKNFTYPSQGIREPAQIGLGYSWGSKEFVSRNNPPGERDSCSYSIYGLDCSGFVYQLFKRNGILIPKGTAADQRRPEELKKRLALYFKNNSFDVVDLGKIETKEIISGDIIYFRNGNNKICHIGIVLVDSEGRIKFFESSGSPNDCAKNILQNRGVRGSVLDARLSTKNFSVVRIKI